MSENESGKSYQKLRKLTKLHVTNLYNEQVKDNCVKVDSEIGKVKCNLCDYETDLEFLHYGSKNRRNERCPNCYSLKRTRHLWYYLENYTDLLRKDDIRVLHTAPETAIYKRVKEELGDRYVSSDIYESPYIDEIIDIQNIPYEDDTFDIIISSHVLEHVPDDRKALEEFYRVLKPEGKLIILIPSLQSLKKTYEFPQINTPQLRQRYYKQNDHRRYYSKDDFYRLLEMVGFKTYKNETKYLKESPDIIERHSLTMDPIFVATKTKKEKKSVDKHVDSSICSICGKKVTFKSNSVNDKICSTCNSGSIERLLYSQTRKIITTSSRILYINPCEALNKKFKEEINNYHVLPENNQHTHLLKDLFNKKDDTKKSLIDELKNIPDESFDIILTSHIHDTTEDDTLLFNQLSRILAKNGKLLLKENIDLALLHKIEDESLNTPKLRGMFYGNTRAIRLYGYDFIEFIEKNKYVVEYENPENQEDNIRLNGELIKDPLLVCTKK